METKTVENFMRSCAAMVRRTVREIHRENAEEAARLLEEIADELRSGVVR